MTPPSMTAELGVSSEIGRLRTVMVHRPGVEIARLTPDNKADLLFDDLLWLERAQQEHDRFAKLMVDRGVEVLYFEDLLSEAIADDAVRDDLLDHAVTPTTCGPRVSEALGAQLRQAPTETVVEVLVGGLLERELVDWGIAHLYEDLVADRFHHVLRPLPNLLFMRDNAAWINNGLSLNVLATPATRAGVDVHADHLPPPSSVPQPPIPGVVRRRPVRRVPGEHRGRRRPRALP